MATSAASSFLESDGFAYAVRFLTGDFPYTAELQCFFIALQGAVAVRRGANADRQLHWWHAFCLSMIGGFGGGWMGFVWMGRPSSMMSNDLNTAAALVAFVLVNYSPFDLGFMLCNTAPVGMITVAFANLFRSLGLAKFVTVCFEAFKDSPSAYYPIPVFGPIMYATLLGNMGGMLLMGFEGYNRDGMPWAFQNGIFCATFFHFYANDADGPIGSALRTYFPAAEWLGLDDLTFATCFVSLFMFIMGQLQLPFVFGPAISPFCALSSLPAPKPKPLGVLANGAAGVAAHNAKDKSLVAFDHDGTQENGKSKRKKKKKKAKEL